MLLQRQLMDCVAVTRVTVHLDTVAISPHAVGSGHYFHLESRDSIAHVIYVPIDATSVRTTTVATNDASSIETH